MCRKGKMKRKIFHPESYKDLVLYYKGISEGYYMIVGQRPFIHTCVQSAPGSFIQHVFIDHLWFLLLNVSDIEMNLWISTIYFLNTALTNSRDNFKTLPQNHVPSLGFHLPQIIIRNRESMAAPAFSLNFYPLSQTWQRGSISMTINFGCTLDSPGKL